MSSLSWEDTLGSRTPMKCPTIWYLVVGTVSLWIIYRVLDSIPFTRGTHLNWGRSLWTYLMSRVMYRMIGYTHHLFFFCFCFLSTTQWLLLSQLFWVNYTHMAGFCISEASCNRSFEQHNKALCNGKEPAGHCWYYPCFLSSHEWVSIINLLHSKFTLHFPLLVRH